MLADPPFLNGCYVEGGNIYGHVVLEEAVDPDKEPVEIGLKVKYRYWGAWIENPPTKTWSLIIEENQHDSPTQAKMFTANKFHRNEIDLGRACHPFLYRNLNPRQSFSRLNKDYVAMD